MALLAHSITPKAGISISFPQTLHVGDRQSLNRESLGGVSHMEKQVTRHSKIPESEVGYNATTNQQ